MAVGTVSFVPLTLGLLLLPDLQRKLVHHMYCWSMSSFGASEVMPSGQGAFQSINILSVVVISISIDMFV